MKIRETDLGSLKKAKESGRDDIDLTKVVIYGVHPSDLEIEPGWNERDLTTERARAHIESIKETLRNGGTIPPLKVRVSGKHVYVRDGHCRLTSVRELIEEGLDIRRVMVEEAKGNDADDVAMMVTSSQGLMLTRLEQGRAAKRLVNFGWTPKEVAARVGQSTTYIEQNLMLANANSDVHLLLQSGSVPPKVALDAIRQHGDKAGAVLADRLLKANANGKTKLTQSAIVGRALPRRVAKQVTEAVAGVFADVSDLLRARIISASPDAKISVSAAHMKALLAAHDAVMSANAARKRTEQATSSEANGDATEQHATAPEATECD
ncbi:hypothetical protein PQR05_29620 [Paraburkholderia sediminicola]|uniref:ParB/RepB/Spo0J family partition protein n=1 Tax=Paraburkholderia sediminicola TaxID=458836 RepID=UPI0038BB4607